MSLGEVMVNHGSLIWFSLIYLTSNGAPQYNSVKEPWPLVADFSILLWLTRIKSSYLEVSQINSDSLMTFGFSTLRLKSGLSLKLRVTLPVHESHPQDALLIRKFTTSEAMMGINGWMIFILWMCQTINGNISKYLAVLLTIMGAITVTRVPWY